MRAAAAPPRRPATVAARAGWLTATIVLAVGCATEAPLPEGPPVRTVTIDEYGIAFKRPVPAGRVVFRVTNDGEQTHEPEFVPLPEDLPPIDEQLQGDQRVPVAPFAGIPPLEPGETGTFAVDLASGVRYAFVCFARDPDDDELHARQGGNAEFRAGGDAAPSPAS